MRTRQWAPVTVLLIVVGFAAIGYNLNNNQPSVIWTLIGLVVGALAVTGIARAVKRPGGNG